MNNLLQNKFCNGDKKKYILSLDGGGVRGVLTLGYLERIEADLRKQYQNDKLVLADHYDLIGGTSTGAMIATCLALGKSVSEIIDLYVNLGKEVFGHRRYPFIPRSWTNTRALMKASYKSEILERLLQDNFGDIALCDYDKFKCPLAIISKRADTYSLWTVSNHPQGIYTGAMKHLKLWELCRASSAAPYYFTAKKLKLKTRANVDTDVTFDAAFIDGGVSLANNPALQLFLTATVPSFGYNWQPGEDKILITSVGTGNGVNKDNVENLIKKRTISWAPKIPELFMTDALEMNLTFLQLFGNNLGEYYTIDSEYGDLKSIAFPTQKLFSYIRCNVKLTVDDLEKKLGIKRSAKKVSSLVEMDHYENIDDLLYIGRKAAETVTNYNLT